MAVVAVVCWCVLVGWLVGWFVGDLVLLLAPHSCSGGSDEEAVVER